MESIHPPFRFEYETPVLRYGDGAVDDLGDELARQGVDRALVVCGQTVGETTEVIEPVVAGIGDRLAGVFDETTPEKRLQTAIDGLAAMDAHDADGLVALGGGSSLDLAKVIAVLAAADRSPESVGREFAETGTLAVPETDVPTTVAVPTTLAGADMSVVAGLSADPSSGLVDESVAGGVSDPALMPGAVVYDPQLFATTPKSILAGSAMNGFDKGIETVYARNATPITDATAVRGLRLLAEGLPELGRREVEPAVLDPVLRGTMLVQYGISRPDGTTLSIVHAFGHGLRNTYGIQQGTAHAIVVPAVLRYLFDRVDARRDLLAEALDVGEVREPAAAVVDVVDEIRRALDLPTELRSVEGVDPDDFPAVATEIVEDGFMANVPVGLDPSVEEIEAVLHDAY